MYFEDCIDLLLITDENKSHYVYTKDYDRFMCNKTKRIENTFGDIFGNVLVVKKSCKNIEKVCLKINSKQSVKLRSGLIKFKIISSN